MERDYSLAKDIKNLFAKADELQKEADLVREQGRALDRELRKRLEQKVEDWRDELISTVEFIDFIEIEARKL